MKTQHTDISFFAHQNHLKSIIQNAGKPKSTARVYSPGMGKAVADRTINRKILKSLDVPEVKKVKISLLRNLSLDQEVLEYCEKNEISKYEYQLIHQTDHFIEIELKIFEHFKLEEWEDVAERVAIGNTSLFQLDQSEEFPVMHEHLRKATILMSGRHLQHGDERQKFRNMEVFTNCATSATSFLSFYLLLNGSGVGRCYDDDLMLVDYKYLPIIVPVIDNLHGDVLSGEISNRLDLRSAKHFYRSKKFEVYSVDDSREGWAKAIEKMEIMAFEKIHRDTVLLLDFSSVRKRGMPIGGMQDRPASGPGPLILAIEKIAKLRDSSMEPWRAAMFCDHYLAECVLVGGARRAARMATKAWSDNTIFDFIELKRGGFLWSSNNSVTVDQDFWNYLEENNKEENDIAKQARSVFKALSEAAYFDGTGEPGIINQDKLVQNDEGFEEYLDGKFAESHKYKLSSESLYLTKALAQRVYHKKYHHITNPCGEITLNMLGGYCVIADVVPYHADTDEEAIDAFKCATRALMRVNLMDSMYKKEVKRTNRIGVGITGFHEWAWKRFGFKDIINEEKSKDMWLLLSRFKREIKREARRYAKVLKSVAPHTDTTIKPAGTTSKLFGLTEGAHLPTMREYLRWVQFRNEDPLVSVYKKRGYPVKELKTYSGTTVVGFPTQPEICKLNMGEKLLTAAEATPEEQYQYLSLLEKYWIYGVDDLGLPLMENTGNQISYTLKYDPSEISFERFMQTLKAGQSKIRCCSVMPQTDASAYEYQPEEKMTIARYHQVISEIQSDVELEEVDFEHVDCQSGACPVDFKSAKN